MKIPEYFKRLLDKFFDLLSFFIFIFLLFLFVKWTCNEAQAQKPGRVFMAPQLLEHLPEKFLKDRDILTDTVSGKSYIYNQGWSEVKAFSPRVDTVIQFVSASDILAANGAIYQNKTFKQVGITQGEISAKYPGYSFTINDNPDYAALQYCVDNYKGIELYGDLYINKKVIVKRDKLSLYINLRGYTITGTAGVIEREPPRSMEEANTMVEAKYIFQNGWINTPGNALKPGPGYGHIAENIRFQNCDTCLKYEFSLKSGAENIEFNNVNNALIFDRLYIAGATNANSQSNSGWSNNIRVYFSQTGSTGIGAYAASGMNGNNLIFEGHRCRAAIDVNTQSSTVVRDCNFNTIHFEVVNKPIEAAFKFRTAAGMYRLNGIFGQYPGIMIDAESSTGNASVKVDNIVYWPTSEKIFKGKNIGWIFNDNETQSGQLTNSNLSGLFVAPAPGLCGGVGCGYYKYYLTPTPR